MIDSGLCGTCVHVQRIVSGRGSEFLRCGRSRTDSRFARYPSLPVLYCPGHEVAAAKPEEPTS